MIRVLKAFDLAAQGIVICELLKQIDLDHSNIIENHALRSSNRCSAAAAEQSKNCSAIALNELRFFVSSLMYCQLLLMTLVEVESIIKLKITVDTQNFLI